MNFHSLKNMMLTIVPNLQSILVTKVKARVFEREVDSFRNEHIEKRVPRS